jgi:hypothetical protein
VASREQDRQAEEVGEGIEDRIEHMSAIEFRRWVRDRLLATDRIPHHWEALARLLAAEVHRERTRRIGAPWEDLGAQAREDARRRLPPGVGRLPT